MEKSKITTVIIVAAGKGLRARDGRASPLPKQYQPLQGKPILRWSIETFLAHPHVTHVVVVIAPNSQDLYDTAIAGLNAKKLLPPVIGGASRQGSVQNGLIALASYTPDRVLIHDAARPLVTINTISNVIEKLAESSGAIAAMPVNDTLKLSSQDIDFITKTAPRDNLWRAQTPQGFHYSVITDLHTKYAHLDLTDDASLLEEAGLSVALVPGNPENFKITQAQDFAMAEKLSLPPQQEYRTGHGFDVHAFEAGDHVVLCGITIPHGQKLKGHSDADVAIHALSDALYGALSAGDIGDHFPPSDPQWRGARSEVFLRHAVDLVAQRGGKIIHCDLTLICEQPKISPHRAAMSENLAQIMMVDPARISVKATTTERLGFTGREEGISTMATATIALPQEA